MAKPWFPSHQETRKKLPPYKIRKVEIDGKVYRVKVFPCVTQQSEPDFYRRYAPDPGARRPLTSQF